LATFSLTRFSTTLTDVTYRQRKTPGACFRRGGAGAYNDNITISSPMVNPFPYSQSIINALERALSPERLSTYLTAAGRDHSAALRLYVWNTQISAALYGPLQALEIIIRNAFHRELSTVYGPAWYDNTRVPLTPAGCARVADAKEAVRRAGRP
jgi:histidinol-phosphate/aromatic aminotransferase/cobyric acid decarboxylase-like protein